jgi:hypothetical protein
LKSWENEFSAMKRMKRMKRMKMAEEPAEFAGWLS